MVVERDGIVDRHYARNVGSERGERHRFIKPAFLRISYARARAIPRPPNSRSAGEVPIVFVTAQSDEDTVERIHEQVPGAPVLSKPVFRHTLADAVAAVTKH